MSRFSRLVFLLLAFSFDSFAFANTSLFRLGYVGEASIKTGTKFNKATIGGLSGSVWVDNSFVALSDDKGRAGEPRYFEFDLKIDKNQVSFSPKAVSFIKGSALEREGKVSVDPEGLVRLPSGDFLISSEGSNDAKPREMPRIFKISADGVWKEDLPIPDKYLPETVGQQKKGIQNNAAFEGLTDYENGKFVFTAIESALTQDYISGEEHLGDWIRILKYERKGESYLPVAEYAYRIDAFKDNQKGKEIFRGVSEVLAISETKLLVMERGVRLFAKNLWAQTVTLYVADLFTGTDVLALNKLSDGKFVGVSKSKILDFETDLAAVRGDKTVQNFEALSWGPKLPNGDRTLLVLSDNNFSKNETTELVVFRVESE